MKIASVHILCFCLLMSCIQKSDVKTEIINFHICISKCSDTESGNNFNYYKCSQDCIDLHDRKMAVCNTLDPQEREKCMNSIKEGRDQCLETCLQLMTRTQSENRAQIKKCQEACIYTLKNK
jgi:hypothetical protein